MSTQLIKYEAARHALAECKAVDEVKTWIDKSAAMKEYARQAQDKGMEVDAAEIRIRAERRLGEMLAASDLHKGGRPAEKTGRHERPVSSPTLAEAGISKDLSSRAQATAAIPEAEFEAEVGEWRERVTAEGARVSARLQAAGEKAQRTAPVEQEGPTAEEVAEAQASERAEAETVRLLLDADDKLAAMTGKVREQAALIVKLEARIRSMTNENAQAVRLVKSWRTKYERAIAEQAA